MRNTTTTTSNAATQGTQQSAQGQGRGQAQQTSWWQAFDWRILLLIFGALSISFTLIFMGFESLSRRPKKKPLEK
jgi:hypothetical protein